MRIILIGVAMLLPVYGMGVSDDSVSYITIDNLIEGLELDKAEEMLKRLDPKPPESAYYYGKLYFYQGKYKEAYDEFMRLNNHDPLAGCAIKAYEITKDYISTETEHFRVYYPSNREEVFIEYLTEGLEDGFKRLSPIFGFVFKDKIRVEILRSPRELSSLTTLPIEAIKKTNTIAVTKFNKIMMLSPENQIEGYDYVTTAVHELVHLMISTVTNERTPVWIHESLAKYFESYSNKRLPDLRPDMLALLKYRLKSKNLITFGQIHPSMALLPSQEDTSVAFAEVFLVSEFLLKRRGINFVRELMAMLRDGLDIDEIFREFGFVSLSGFEKVFFRYLEERTEESAAVEHLYYEKAQKGGRRSEYLGDVMAMKYVKIGDLLFLEGLHQAAFLEYEKASRSGIVNPHIENRKAFTLLKIGRFEEASRILEKIVDIYPDYLPTFINLARSYIARREYSECIYALDRAVRINPFDREIYLMYIRVFIEQQNQFELEKMKKKLEALK